jgi:hypothetical protein
MGLVTQWRLFMREDTFDYTLPSVVSVMPRFLSGEINIMSWAPGLKNNAVALTKRNYAMFSLLNNICGTLILPHHMFEREIKYDSKTWR